MKETEWIIPVEWAMAGYLKVQAGSLEKAIEMVKRDEDEYGKPFALPQGNYLDGSFQITKGYTNEEIRGFFNQEEKTAECIDCGYKGIYAYWKGSITSDSGERVEMEGNVFLRDDDTYDLDELIERTIEKVSGNIDEFADFDGEAFCPKCGSENIY